MQDLTGKFVMPGLIDLHTHVSNSDVEMQDPVRFFTREGVTRDLHLYASYGTTSVASLGTDQKPLVYEMRAEQRKGRPTVARIFTAGRGFTVKDGFPTNKGNVPGIPYEPSTPAEAAAQMEELAAEHPDVVKIWVDDRFGDFKKTPIEISQADHRGRAQARDQGHRARLLSERRQAAGSRGAGCVRPQRARQGRGCTSSFS